MLRSLCFCVLMMFFGLVLGGCLAGAAVDEHRGSVTIREDTLTLPWYTSEPIWQVRPRANDAIWPQRETRRAAGERTFATVELENAYLRIQIIPEVGGVVHRVIHKPGGEDMFFLEGKAKNWLPFWESGIKVSFPWREHCVRVEDQPAAWHAIEHEDGSITVSMWMEFSRHNEPWERTMFGRFSTMFLSQHVTLRPDETTFSVTYRIINPTSYRQGRRLWTDALYPRNHTPEEVVQGDAFPPPTPTQFILPAATLADHRALNIRPHDRSRTALIDHTSVHNSLFGIDRRHGFAGFWYPKVGVNRLRIDDPGDSPGAKFYWRGESTYKPWTWDTHPYNFAELWGGTDHVMEGVENWIGPGETFAFTHHYTMVQGIGRADYANQNVVVSLGTAGKPRQVELVTLRPYKLLTVRWNDQLLGEPRTADPGRPMRLALPAGEGSGTLQVEADGLVLLDQAFPLAIEADASSHDAIVRASQLNCVEGTERLGYQMDYGRRLETAVRNYPAGSLGRGRIEYRLGRLEAAKGTLEQRVGAEPGDGEAWHMLGIVLLELGEAEQADAALAQAVAAAMPFHAARYYLAVRQIAAGSAADAARTLDELIRLVPGHWEAKLLRAWINGADGLAEAADLHRVDPADPRAALVLLHCATEAGSVRHAKTARRVLDRMVAEPGTKSRVEEFRAMTRGEYRRPNRIKPFP